MLAVLVDVDDDADVAMDVLVDAPASATSFSLDAFFTSDSLCNMHVIYSYSYNWTACDGKTSVSEQQ